MLFGICCSFSILSRFRRHDHVPSSSYSLPSKHRGHNHLSGPLMGFFLSHLVVHAPWTQTLTPQGMISCLLSAASKCRPTIHSDRSLEGALGLVTCRYDRCCISIYPSHDHLRSVWQPLPACLVFLYLLSEEDVSEKDSLYTRNYPLTPSKLSPSHPQPHLKCAFLIGDCTARRPGVQVEGGVDKEGLGLEMERPWPP